jgi:hypothetical protein
MRRDLRVSKLRIGITHGKANVPGGVASGLSFEDPCKRWGGKRRRVG